MKKNNRQINLCGHLLYVFFTEHMLFDSLDSCDLSTMKFALVKITLKSPIVENPSLQSCFTLHHTKLSQWHIHFKVPNLSLESLKPFKFFSTSVDKETPSFKALFPQQLICRWLTPFMSPFEAVFLRNCDQPHPGSRFWRQTYIILTRSSISLMQRCTYPLTRRIYCVIATPIVSFQIVKLRVTGTAINEQ